MEKWIEMSAQDLEMLHKKTYTSWIGYVILIIILSFFILVVVYDKSVTKYNVFLLILIFLLIGLGLSSIFYLLISKHISLNKDIARGQKLQVIGKIDKKITMRSGKYSEEYWIIHGKAYLTQDYPQVNSFKTYDVIQIEYAPNAKIILSVKMIDDSKTIEDTSKIEQMGVEEFKRRYNF